MSSWQFSHFSYLYHLYSCLTMARQSRFICAGEKGIQSTAHSVKIMTTFQKCPHVLLQVCGLCTDTWAREKTFMTTCQDTSLFFFFFLPKMSAFDSTISSAAHAQLIEIIFPCLLVTVCVQVSAPARWDMKAIKYTDFFRQALIPLADVKQTPHPKTKYVLLKQTWSEERSDWDEKTPQSYKMKKKM